MFTHQTTKRVRYAETDKMGYLYYGNYAMYYEIGRVEALRDLGLTYLEIEDDLNIAMPVAQFNTKYIRPAYYDELLTIKTQLNELPERRMVFRGEIFNEKGDLLNIGQVTLAFVDIKSKGTISAPKILLDKLSPYFEDEENEQ